MHLCSFFSHYKTRSNTSRALSFIASRTFQPSSHSLSLFQLFHSLWKISPSNLSQGSISAGPLRSAAFSLASLSSFSWKAMESPCSRALPLSATAVLLVRTPSAASYKVTTFHVLGSPTRLLSAHRKLKSSTTPSSMPALSSRATRCRKRLLISALAASLHETPPDCLPRDFQPALPWHSPLSHTLLSWEALSAIPKPSSRFLLMTMSPRMRSPLVLSTGRYRDERKSSSPSFRSKKSRMYFAPFLRSVRLIC